MRQAPGLLFSLLLATCAGSGAVLAQPADSGRQVSAGEETRARPAWTVTAVPPVMDKPRRLRIPQDLKLAPMPAWSVLCAGQAYWVQLPPTEDAILEFRGERPVTHPIWIVGGRHVRVIGLQMELEVQPGCEPGKLPNDDGPEGATNVHPRIPGAMALRLEQAGVSFVEGAFIDIGNAEADCFVIRNADGVDAATARRQRDVVIQNSACHGIGGLGASAGIGDGFHGDLIQNQGTDVMRSLIVENVSTRSASEGIVLHRHGEFNGAIDFVLRRFDYTFDDRYVGLGRYNGPWGISFVAWADRYQFDEVWIEDYRDGGNYGLMNPDTPREQRYGDSPSADVKRHPGIRGGRPPQGPFAPIGRIGRHYASPHPVP